MKKPFVIMLIIILAIIVLVGGGAGTYLYLKHHHKAAAKSGVTKVLTAPEALALQVTLPQMTTNLESSGLIQFTLTLQADDNSTKTELTQMQNQIQDKVNDVMRQFTPDQLHDDHGITVLKQALMSNVNGLLQNGHVTNVYLSQVLVQ